MTSLFEIVPEREGDEAGIETIHELTFGPGRFARTAFRIRERGATALAFVALHDGAVIGSVRLTSVTIGGEDGLLLGPLAVHPDWAGRGAGRALMWRALGAARSGGWGIVALVGDPAYYEQFGFRRAAMTLPGPADPERVLAVMLRPGAGAAGPIEARPAAGISVLPDTTQPQARRAAAQGR